MEEWSLERVILFTTIRTIGLELIQLKNEPETKENKERIKQLKQAQYNIRKEFIKEVN